MEDPRFDSIFEEKIAPQLENGRVTYDLVDELEDVIESIIESTPYRILYNSY